MARLLKEPFYIRARQPPERVEAQARVLAHDRPAHRGRCKPALFHRNVGLERQKQCWWRGDVRDASYSDCTAGGTVRARV